MISKKEEGGKERDFRIKKKREGCIEKVVHKNKIKYISYIHHNIN